MDCHFLSGSWNKGQGLKSYKSRRSGKQAHRNQTHHSFFTGLWVCRSGLGRGAQTWRSNLGHRMSARHKHNHCLWASPLLHTCRFTSFHVWTTALWGQCCIPRWGTGEGQRCEGTHLWSLCWVAGHSFEPRPVWHLKWGGGQVKAAEGRSSKLSWPHPYCLFWKGLMEKNPGSHMGRTESWRQGLHRARLFATRETTKANSNSDNHFDTFPAMLNMPTAGKTWKTPIRLKLSMRRTISPEEALTWRNAWDIMLGKAEYMITILYKSA